MVLFRVITLFIIFSFSLETSFSFNYLREVKVRTNPKVYFVPKPVLPVFHEIEGYEGAISTEEIRDLLVSKSAALLRDSIIAFKTHKDSLLILPLRLAKKFSAYEACSKSCTVFVDIDSIRLFHLANFLAKHVTHKASLASDITTLFTSNPSLGARVAHLADRLGAPDELQQLLDKAAEDTKAVFRPELGSIEALSDGELAKRIDTKSRSVNLSGLDLTSLLGISRLPRNTRVLDLSRNNLTMIPGWIFSLFPELHTLILSHNRITYIDEDALAQCQNLVHFDLSYNQLATLPSRITVHSPHLRILNLAYCAREGESLDLEKTFLINAKHLRALDISSNGLCSLPVLSSLKELETLIANDNRLTTFPRIERCPVLSVVSLCNNTLATLPSHLPPQLCVIDLAGNAALTREKVSGLAARSKATSDGSVVIMEYDEIAKVIGESAAHFYQVFFSSLSSSAAPAGCDAKIMSLFKRTASFDDILQAVAAIKETKKKMEADKRERGVVQCIRLEFGMMMFLGGPFTLLGGLEVAGLSMAIAGFDESITKAEKKTTSFEERYAPGLTPDIISFGKRAHSGAGILTLLNHYLGSLRTFLAIYLKGASFATAHKILQQSFDDTYARATTSCIRLKRLVYQQLFTTEIESTELYKGLLPAGVCSPEAVQLVELIPPSESLFGLEEFSFDENPDEEHAPLAWLLHGLCSLQKAFTTIKATAGKHHFHLTTKIHQGITSSRKDILTGLHIIHNGFLAPQIEATSGVTPSHYRKQVKHLSALCAHCSDMLTEKT